ncbi:MAG: hypothetical protein IJ391_07400 [Clostridia bacterium]|nr:hypothetical protein [Clostridia bacterium]
MKINIIKRTLSFLIAGLLTLSLISCAGSDTSEDTQSGISGETVSGSTETAQPEIPVKTDKQISDEAIAAILESDFGGDNVIIVTSNDDTVLPEDTVNVVNRKRYERLNVLENKFNFTFVRRELTDNAMYNGARNAYNSELYYADLMYTSPSQLYRYQSNSMAANIGTLPFVMLDAPYFDKASMEQASADGMIYAAIGESNMNADNLAGVFFNKEILVQLTDEDIYGRVYDKTWTLEYMTLLSKAAAYTDGIATGLRGTLTDLTADNFIDNIYFSANGHNVSAGSGMLPLYTPFDEAAQLCADGVYDLMYNKNGFTRANNARARFEAGESLFLVTSLSEKNDIAYDSFNWGILPLPLYTEGGDYRTFKDNALPVTVVLSSTPDLTRSGILLEGVNAAMYGYVKEAYFDECMYEIVRDNDTLNMIDIIIDGAQASFAHMFGAGTANLDDCTYLAVRNTVKTARNLEYYNNRGTQINELLTEEFDR